ncbi:hypothetical protein [Microlunatus antarcticus]|uniref:Uncharacterized protein n=1 Tax=Microlunatus antarcticus TaxID=53388 RepID=A0A7W5JTE2_9ACTN|nr:hypothetical protein [Microlunatus antarcticus]MBB3325885.1 hypothetical protein [Microlunatus antarcticus]
MAWAPRWLRARPAVLVDLPPSAPSVDERARLRRVAAEAVILQDRAEAVLVAVRTHGHLGTIAPLGGPLVRRFFALREELPERCVDPDDERLRNVLDVALHSHALVVAMSMDLLAYEWRSPRLLDVVSRIEGLGAAGVALDAAYAELAYPAGARPAQPLAG